MLLRCPMLYEEILGFRSPLAARRSLPLLSVLCMSRHLLMWEARSFDEKHILFLLSRLHPISGMVPKYMGIRRRREWATWNKAVTSAGHTMSP